MIVKNKLEMSLLRLVSLLTVFLIPVSHVQAFLDEEVSICQIQAQADNRVYIKPCERRESKNSCGSGLWVAWTLNDNPGTTAMYSTALSAYMAGKKVTLRFTESDNSCVGLYDETKMIRT